MAGQEKRRGRGIGRALAACGSWALFAASAAAQAPPGLAEIIEVVEITSLSVAPDGEGVAFRTEQARIDGNTHLLAWHVAHPERSVVHRIAGGGAPLYNDPGAIIDEPPLWSPRSDAIFYRALVDDAIGVWRAPVDGKGAALVFRDDADVESLRAADGRMLATLGPSRDAVRAAEKEEYLDGILVDETVALNQNLVRSGFVDGRLATQRLHGQWFTRKGLLADAPRTEREIDPESLAAGPPKPAPPRPPLPVLGTDPGITVGLPDGSSVRAVREGRQTRVELLDADGEPAARCDAPACRERVVALARRPGTRQVLLTILDRHLGHSLHLWDTSSGEVRRVAGDVGYLGGGRDWRQPCALTARAAICVASSAVSPPRLMRIDLEDSAGTVLFDPNAGLRQRRMPKSELLSWSGPDEEEYHGILLLPSDRPAADLPLFVNYYHCGGFLSGGVGDELPFLALASAGMAVACINVAPSAGEEEFLGRYDQGLRAVRALVESLGQIGTIDPGRVGMAGLSFGSEVTMWTLVRSDLLAAAAIASTQMEPTYYWFNSVRGRNQPDVLRRFWGLGSPDETPEAWRRTSAALNVDSISAPLLMQLPEQEARSVIQLYARLSRSPVPTELHVFPDAAHLKIQPRHRLAAHRRYLDWFRYWLQDEVDQDAAKAGQYRRWRALRERWRESSTP